MNRVLQIVLSLLWALWLGGLVMLFVAVQTLFNTFTGRSDLAGKGAAGIFHVFNYYHFVLAALSLVATFCWWLGGRSGGRISAFFLFAIATLAAVYVSAALTPELERLRVDNLTQSARFRQLHGMSMGLYLLETIFVFMAGLIVQWTGRTAESNGGSGARVIQI